MGRRRHRRLSFTGAAVLLLAAIAAFPVLFSEDDAPRRGRSAGPAESRTERAARVIDGDSLKLESGEDLRLIGIDCPERGEPFHAEAAAKTAALVLGRELRVELDGEERDRYGRLLGYVHAGDTFVNEALAREGLAWCYEVPPNVRHAGRLRSAQDAARRERAGVWSAAAEAGEVVASRSGKFHRPNCPSVGLIRDPVRYAGRDDALDAGLSQCRSCKP